MDCTLLKLADKERKPGFRKWSTLKIGLDTGYVSLGSAQTYPKLGGIWFMWKFHEHYMGCGGLEITKHKSRVRTMVTNLIDHNQGS